jgi:hypothetical protein
MEARAGQGDMARAIFQYLIQTVPWHGPIYQEAARFEEKREAYQSAADIIQAGLKACPKYGPLWFADMHMKEKMVHLALHIQPLQPGMTGGHLPEMQQTRAAIDASLQHISKELAWKV